MTRSIAGLSRVFAFAALMAATSCGARRHDRAPDLRCRRDDAARRRPDQRFAVSLRSLADQSQDIQTFNDTTLPQSLARSAPGVTVGNVSGNEFEPDLFYRGFDATAVTGTPQGLAVYQNGTRINEAFGDTVNWDLIPANAIDKTTIIAANPIFGLNALGGAVTVTMKNGFTWQGFEADLEGGSYLRAQEEIQYGKQFGDWSVYVAATQINDGGWRVAQSVPAHQHLRRRRLQGERVRVASATDRRKHPVRRLRLHAGPATADELGQRLHRSSDDLQPDGHAAWTGAYAYSPTLNFQAGAYFRQFNQQHVDGNGTDVTPCPPYSCLNGTPVHGTMGGIIPDISQGGTLDLGENDDNQTQSRSVGVSGQVVDTDKVFNHDNSLTVGASLDYGWTHYTGNSKLGTIAFTKQLVPADRLPLHY